MLLIFNLALIKTTQAEQPAYRAIEKKLTQSNRALKENLKTYLGEHRMLTDVVNIIDGFIVNIGCNFEIICYSNYNKREVLAACIQEMQSFFNIDNWTFNKPINIFSKV